MKHLRNHLAAAVAAIMLVALTGATLPAPAGSWTPCSAPCSLTAGGGPCDTCCLGCLSLNMKSYNNCIRCCAKIGTAEPCLAVAEPEEPTP